MIPGGHGFVCLVCRMAILSDISKMMRWRLVGRCFWCVMLKEMVCAMGPLGDYNKNLTMKGTSLVLCLSVFLCLCLSLSLSDFLFDSEILLPTYFPTTSWHQLPLCPLQRLNRWEHQTLNFNLQNYEVNKSILIRSILLQLFHHCD